MAINEQNTLYVTVQDAWATMLSSGKPGLVLQTDGEEPIAFELTPATILRIRTALDKADGMSMGAMQR